MLVLLLSFLLLLAGCGGGNGGNQSQPPPSPMEAKVLAQTIMAIGIHSQKLDPEKITKLEGIFHDARSTLQLAMAEDPTTVEPITLAFVGKLDPIYQEATKGMLQIFMLRLRPYLAKGGNTELASTYIDAVFDGAILACGQALESQPAETS
jgi:hypothetical protein